MIVILLDQFLLKMHLSGGGPLLKNCIYAQFWCTCITFPPCCATLLCHTSEGNTLLHLSKSYRYFFGWRLYIQALRWSYGIWRVVINHTIQQSGPDQPVRRPQSKSKPWGPYQTPHPPSYPWVPQFSIWLNAKLCENMQHLGITSTRAGQYNKLIWFIYIFGFG